jgi:pimeloyl-ACP methyl ester carboxylesterase
MRVARQGLLLALVLPLVGCSPNNTTPPTSGATSTPPASTVIPHGDTTAPPPSPDVSLDPSMSAEELFAEDTPIDQLGVVEVSTGGQGVVSIREIEYRGADGHVVQAYVLTPADGEPRAGVLFLHWLGEFDSNRDEFFDEAMGLAANGIQAILIDQRFPFVERASGLEHDRVEIGYQVRAARRALTILANDVGDAPLAVVGHDFGGMYAAVLRGLEPQLNAVVIMASTGTWADWFVHFVNVVPESEAPAYRAGLEDLDPITWIDGPGDGAALFQFSSFDLFIPRSKADAFVEAAGTDAEARFYDAGHELDVAARTDRTAWLLEQLRPE